MIKLIKYTIIGAFTAATIGISSIIYLINFYDRDLPDYRQLEEYNPPVTSRLYSRDGILIAEFSKENRQFVPFEKIPQKLVNAFIAAEDQNFYSHPGVDYTSVVRVIFQNILNVAQNKSLVGGSTITQQVVKNFLLSNERSISRKVREAILAFRITQVYSKNRILELYLNQIYLGNSAYGIATAARSYFDKSIDDLTISECAYLAGLPKAPSTYNPNSNYERAKARRDYVIDRMYEDNMITEEEAKIAVGSKLLLSPPPKRTKLKAEYFIEETRRLLVEKLGEKTLYEGGLNIVSTIDINIQKIIERELKNGLIGYDTRFGYRKPVAHINLDNWTKEIKALPRPLLNTEWTLAVITKVLDTKMNVKFLPNKSATINMSDNTWIKKNFNDIFKPGDVIYIEDKSDKYIIRQIPEISGGIIAMDPRTGKILGMSGGFDFGISQFNRVTQALRQPGSTFKTFVYLAALEQGVLPNKIFTDGPIEIYQGPGLPMWRPKNYKGDFLGDITFRTALEKSRNTVTARLSQVVSMNKIAELSKRIGINENPKKNFAAVLGSEETTLHNITRAYSIIANNGINVKTNFIDIITDQKSNILDITEKNLNCPNCNLEHIKTAEMSKLPSIFNDNSHIIDERTAYQIKSILEGVVQRGTARAAKILGHKLFGKTGTSNDSKDVWFIGGNEDIIIGTYMGYDQPKDMGKRMTGATLALPIFVESMKDILKDYKDTDEYIPEGISFYNVDSSTGMITNEDADGKKIIKEAFKSGNEPINLDIKQNDDINTNIVKPYNEEVFDEDSIY